MTDRTDYSDEYLKEHLVTIPRGTFENLIKDEKLLYTLKAHGVSNWEGYSDAYNEAFPEDEEEEV